MPQAVIQYKEHMRTLQKTLILAGIGALLATGITLVELRQVEGQGSPGNARGWAWGGTEQVFTYGTPPQTVTSPTGLGWISMSNVNTGGGTQYGVDIPAQNGDVTGSAWSENVGWIDFQPGGTPPIPGEQAGVRRQGTNLEGWARIRNIDAAGRANPPNAGGFAGWINMRSRGAGINYGVTITPQGGNDRGTLGGYAWSDEFGWIDFSGACFGLAACNVQLPGPQADVYVVAGQPRIQGPYTTPPGNIVLGGAGINTTACTLRERGGNVIQWTQGPNQNPRRPEETFYAVQVNVTQNAIYDIDCDGLPGSNPATASDSIQIIVRPFLTVSCEPRVRGTRRSVVYRTRSNPQARVDWTAIHDGTQPFTYTWNFDPAPTAPPAPYQNANPLTARYGTDGEMNAHVSVLDSAGRTGEANCSPVTVQYLDIIEVPGGQ